MREGDLGTACQFSAASVRGGLNCRSLAPLVYACQVHPYGRRQPPLLARRGAAQIAAIGLSGTSGTAELRAERQSSRGVVAAIVLEKERTKWRVGSVLDGKRSFNFLRMNESLKAASFYSRLFAPGCSKVVFGGKAGGGVEFR